MIKLEWSMPSRMPWPSLLSSARTLAKWSIALRWSLRRDHHSDSTRGLHRRRRWPGCTVSLFTSSVLLITLSVTVAPLFSFPQLLTSLRPSHSFVHSDRLQVLLPSYSLSLWFPILLDGHVRQEVDNGDYVTTLIRTADHLYPVGFYIWLILGSAIL